MKIRPAAGGDFDGIVEMCVSSMRATYGGFFSEEQMLPWIEGGETEKYVASALAGMLVMEEGGRVLGVVALKEDRVDLLWVSLEHRGRGAGRALMAAAEEALRTRGVRAATLEVFEPNAGAVAFYERLGWTQKDRYLDSTAGVNKILMSKRLVERAPS